MKRLRVPHHYWSVPRSLAFCSWFDLVRSGRLKNHNLNDKTQVSRPCDLRKLSGPATWTDSQVWQLFFSSQWDKRNKLFRQNSPVANGRFRHKVNGSNVHNSPSFFMPALKHFRSLQYLHWLRLSLSTTQFLLNLRKEFNKHAGLDKRRLEKKINK